MSLDKAIKHGKEHRKPYRGGKAIDPECRNHGGCPACLSNRLHSDQQRMDACDEQVKQYAGYSVRAETTEERRQRLIKNMLKKAQVILDAGK